MASLTLGVLAQAAPIANPALNLLFQVGAKLAGNALDDQLFGQSSNTHREGSRLESLLVQSSTYGTMIPLVYGNARIAGNVIWAEPMKEVGTTTTTSQGGGKGGGSSTTSLTTEYSYFATLAIAICDGPIDSIERVWADAGQLDISLGTYRFYNGSEAQEPDPYIESIEGVGSTPAYRGLSYVVIEDFPLADYGNRIPNFTFEVKKKALSPDADDVAVEEQLKAMVLIPGSGEFVYDDTKQEKIDGQDINGNFVQQGLRSSINQHTPYGKANGLVALDQLEATCPNLEWIAVVVNWFGNSLDAANCIVQPGVEYADGLAQTTPDTWAVGGYDRSTARQITYVDNSPRYGGTPSDASLLRYLSEIKSRGYNILLLPMMLMDVTDKPWRGRISGTTLSAADFFTKTEGYNAFINHYANLTKQTVDAIVIGSEMIGLTKVNDGAASNRSFPAVDKFVDLAATVKQTVGSGVKVGYAADWSEYHHTDDGWYNLDPLWASPNIDFIGIDAYFPLTDAPQSTLGYDIDTVKDGWTSGEGYDFYYIDGSRTTTAPLGAAYAWKNIDWWWTNT
ncbi:MAG: glycoside hydrolase TIM-barrel-like domain-containing protein, partial [Rickettsiales bacterium]|nr:glycoside hydrolase TIM-barrel-like domain-containing protein [Rickettsiales bacterium]